ncbi:MAG: biopolymer transporter [Pleurocapsa sp. SU_5_0]|nr:biopolymer transporter [Pleurocapsa sp. SU_5_0]NJO97042.1 biopolymer transporter [Pleurocapsa sp. CRU_1_2]NJR46087.1 biopolymer transporter [Hyellaceae cyanobacterium CSU_1_1]
MKWYLKPSSVKITLAITTLVLGSCQSKYITPPTQAINASLNSFAPESDANFSYNGRYLVYTSDRAAKRSVYLYDLQQRRLVSLPGLNQPRSMQSQADISADGRYIVYCSEQLGKTDIYLYDRSNATSDNLTKNFIGEVRYPSISGDGRFISFEGNRSGQWDIEIYDRGTGINLSAPQNSSVTPATP